MPTALIIGAGANVGVAVAEAFQGAGYSVAVASRSNKTGSQFKHFPFDAAKPETVPSLFAQVKETLGTPSVVIYNAYRDSQNDPSTPFQLPVSTFNEDLNINTVSTFAAAHAATDAWSALAEANALGPEGATFIFTGNLFNHTVAPGFLTFGMAKAASAHMIQYLALLAFEGKPFKFYFPDQREDDGTPMYNGPNGAAHAALYLDLAQDSTQRHWLQTFVAGKGYKKFDRPDALTALPTS